VEGEGEGKITFGEFISFGSQTGAEAQDLTPAVYLDFIFGMVLVFLEFFLISPLSIGPPGPPRRG